MKTIKSRILLFLVVFIEFVRFTFTRKKRNIDIPLFATVRTAIGYENAVKSGIIEERTNIDVSEKLWWDKPEESAIYHVLNVLRKNSSVAQSTEVSAFEQRSAPDKVVMNGAASGVGTVGGNITITLRTTPDEARFMHARQTIKFLNVTTVSPYVVDAEVVSVDTAAHTMVVKPIDLTGRLAKDVSTPFASGTEILITGNINEEFAGSVVQPTILPEKVTNNTQILRDNFALSRTAGKMRMYGPTERNRLMQITEYVHKKNLSKTLLFNGPRNKKKQSTSSNVEQGYLQGLQNKILSDSPKNQTYVTSSDFGAAHELFSANIFDPMLPGGTNGVRMLWCNQAYRNFFYVLKRDKPGIEITDADDFKGVFGISTIEKVKTGDGTFYLFVDPIINTVYSNKEEPYGMALHLGNLELKVIQDTILKANIQNNDEDGTKDEYLTEFTYILTLPECFGIIKKA